MVYVSLSVRRVIHSEIFQDLIEEDACKAWKAAYGEVSGLGANTSGFWFSSMTVNR